MNQHSYMSKYVHVMKNGVHILVPSFVNDNNAVQHYINMKFKFNKHA